MAERLERRTHFSEVDTSSISRFAALFSPFQALHVPVSGLHTVLNSIFSLPLPVIGCRRCDGTTRRDCSADSSAYISGRKTSIKFICIP